ncbi:hypothetical protein ACHQM5_002224 [Ranunculus cassubicifolius]
MCFEIFAWFYLQHGETPLHMAAKNGCSNAIQVLLEHGASVGVKAKMSQTPLHIAVENNNVEVIKFLLGTRGPGFAKLESSNKHGETPVHIAAKNGYNGALKVLLDHGASMEAKDKNGMTPLHLAVWFTLQTDDSSIVKLLLEHNADTNVKDDSGLSDYFQHKQLKTDIEDHRKGKAVEAFNEKKSKIAEIEEAISNIIGMEDLKEQLTKWAKGMLIDEQRAALGLKIGPRRAPHVAFLGNPGTGKTMVARLLGNILHTTAIIPSDKVVEVQRGDLIGEYVGHTGPKTREKIEEAEGGILFVDEAYRLTPSSEESSKDFGKEALEEIMSAMDSGKVMVIFAGYKEPMKHVIAANQGFARRVTKFFSFSDYTSEELSQIIHLKMTKQKEEDLLYGYKLHKDCTLDAIAEIIDNETSKTQRGKLNGGLADLVIRNARENLDRRLYAATVESDDLCKVNGDELVTLTLEDIEAGIKLLPHEIK